MNKNIFINRCTILQYWWQSNQSNISNLIIVHSSCFLIFLSLCFSSRFYSCFFYFFIFLFAFLFCSNYSSCFCRFIFCKVFHYMFKFILRNILHFFLVLVFCQVLLIFSLSIISVCFFVLSLPIYLKNCLSNLKAFFMYLISFVYFLFYYVFSSLKF